MVDSLSYEVFSTIQLLLFSFTKDPRDAPPPTRAETREERLERKVGKATKHLQMTLAVIDTCAVNVYFLKHLNVSFYMSDMNVF